MVTRKKVKGTNGVLGVLDIKEVTMEVDIRAVLEDAAAE